MNTVARQAFYTFKLMRPRQWLKNVLVFATILFTGQLFNPVAFTSVFLAFVVFCGLSSAIYIINDIVDREKDRLHPFKRFRPIAHGDISTGYALIVFALLTTGSFALSLLIDPAFVFICCVYMILQLSYSMWIKHIEILDILALAAGYMLRVFAGEVVSDYHISVWLILTTVAISLFVAVGKRRSELTLISHFPAKQIEATRRTLSHYSERLLDVYASIFATATFVFYSLFTFQEAPQGFRINNAFLLPEFLPDFLNRKWLMVTILPVVYGLLRYLQDIYERHEGESPEKVLLSDRPLLAAVIIWAMLVILIIYFFR
jgi:4-hydroxybenzoate polyprenyltransferase